MITPATVNAPSARFETFLNRTPLEEELFRDLAETTFRDAEAALAAVSRRGAVRGFGRVVEKFVEKTLDRFVRIAEARRRRRTLRTGT